MSIEKEQSMGIRSIEVGNNFESNSLHEDVVDHLPDDLVVVDQLDADDTMDTLPLLPHVCSCPVCCFCCWYQS